MIQIIDQSTSHTQDGKTRLTFTIEIPAREQNGAPLDLKRGLPFRLAQGLAEPEPAKGPERSRRAAGAQWPRAGGHDRGSQPL